LRVTEPASPIVYARVESKTAFSQIYIGAEKRRFVFDLWRHGVSLANGATPEILEMARAIDEWITTDRTTSDLASAFPFVVASEDAAAYERGEAVEFRWQKYLVSDHWLDSELTTFAAAAAAEPRLRQLFPFTSMFTFCFSRCTGFPFTKDTPTVRSRGSGVYEVFSASGQSLGRGTAAEAAALVVAALPPDCGPAVAGTADDLARA